MQDVPPFRRYETVAGVEYEILNSRGTAYYTVPLINGRGAGCECRHVQFKPMCSHQDEAEKQERLYRQSQQSQPITSYATAGTLNNSNRGFKLLR